MIAGGGKKLLRTLVVTLIFGLLLAILTFLQSGSIWLNIGFAFSITGGIVLAAIYGDFEDFKYYESPLFRKFWPFIMFLISYLINIAVLLVCNFLVAGLDMTLLEIAGWSVIISILMIIAGIFTADVDFEWLEWE
jgi:hypothetical protein